MRWVKRLGMVSLSFLVMLLGSSALFVQCSPQFGGSLSAAELQRFEKTGHYKGGKFQNLEPFHFEVNCHSVTAMLKKMLNPPVGKRPPVDIKVKKLDPRIFQSDKTKIAWLGHSSLIVRLDGKTILLDPVFGQYAAPHSWLGQRRYSKELPIQIKDIPSVDAVFISHDHYDHLDYGSIVELAPKTKKFLVPLGVGSHLRRWGVKAEQIQELDWWQETKLGTIRIVLTPSQHMSGRSLTGQSSTLWGSWVFKGKRHSIFFSGDGGYGGHFKKIGAKYGPFDLALMECGQYDELWARVHLSPEQTVKAGMEVKGKRLMPIHWGAFTLANHTWTDPVVRFTAAARAKKQPFTTPQIGQVIDLDQAQLPAGRWWEKYGKAKR